MPWRTTAASQAGVGPRVVFESLHRPLYKGKRNLITDISDKHKRFRALQAQEVTYLLKNHNAFPGKVNCYPQFCLCNSFSFFRIKFDKNVASKKHRIYGQNN